MSNVDHKNNKMIEMITELLTSVNTIKSVDYNTQNGLHILKKCNKNNSLLAKHQGKDYIIHMIIEKSICLC